MQRQNNKKTQGSISPRAPSKNYTEIKLDLATKTQLQQLAKGISQTNSTVEETADKITFARYSRKYQTVKFDIFATHDYLDVGGNAEILSSTTTKFFKKGILYLKSENSRVIKRIATKSTKVQKKTTTPETQAKPRAKSATHVQARKRSKVACEANITRTVAKKLHMVAPVHSENYSYLNMRNLQADKFEGKNLQTFLYSRQQPSNPLYNFLIALDVAIQICVNFEKLHQKKKFIHCDIKPENIMLFKNKEKWWQIQLIDFGLAKKIGELRGYCGTPPYIDPKLLKTFNEKVDEFYSKQQGVEEISVVELNKYIQITSEATQDYFPLALVVGELLLGLQLPAETSTETEDSALCSLMENQTFDGNNPYNLPIEQYKLIKKLLLKLSTQTTNLSKTINAFKNLAADIIISSYCNELKKFIRFLETQNNFKYLNPDIFKLANRTKEIFKYADAKNFLCELFQLANAQKKQINDSSFTTLRSWLSNALLGTDPKTTQRFLSIITGLAVESSDSHYWLEEYRTLIFFISSREYVDEDNYPFHQPEFVRHSLQDTLETKQERKASIDKRF